MLNRNSITARKTRLLDEAGRGRNARAAVMLLTQPPATQLVSIRAILKSNSSGTSPSGKKVRTS